MQQYFLNAFCFSTKDGHVSTVEQVFKDYLNHDGNINEHPIISYLEELVEKGMDESLVFGLDNVEKAYSNYELKHLISNDEDV